MRIIITSAIAAMIGMTSPLGLGQEEEDTTRSHLGACGVMEETAGCRTIQLPVGPTKNGQTINYCFCPKLTTPSPCPGDDDCSV